MPTVTKIPATISRFTSQPIDIPTKRKVAAYARVSTDSEDQLTSYEAQVSYYTDYIKSRQDWEFVKVYTDEGISGVSTKGRQGFNEMVADALAGKINLIITKSVSRFARNTVDSLTTIRKLKEHNVECYFEKEAIWSFDTKCELVLSVLSSIAQEESRSISENVTWGCRKKMSDGKYSMPYSSFLGYDKGEDGKLVVNPEQAKIVRLIFQLFLEGMSPYSIAKELTTRKIKTPMNRDKWNPSTIRTILSNEKYKGDALLQKTFCSDFLTKKVVVNKGQIPQYYIEDDHEAIISPTIFDIVQEELKHRAKTNQRYSRVSIFSSKMKCADCGNWYGAKVWQSNTKYRKIIYQCNFKFRQKSKCETPHLSEEDIKRMFVDAVNQIIKNKNEIIENIRSLISAISDTTSLELQQKELHETLRITVKLIEKLIAENARTILDQSNYIKRYDTLSQKYNSAKSEYEKVSDEITDIKSRIIKLNDFIATLENTENILIEFDVNIWSSLVEYGTVQRDGSITFHFRNGMKITAK
ncbi:MAG: recombinase family protein [Ruminococcus flavefaciens]|nr:recombinase family protein [Ruminococcus flavefaciens]MCM1230294.1 recombinase family protein [Ruminococcus flavefaciens]